LALFPLSISELEHATLLPHSIEEAVFKGSYPKIYAQQIDPEKLYANYIRIYIERDVRQIKNIADLTLFQRFIQLCAGRIGQVLNVSSLGNDCGIDHKTASAWLSLLEASYIIFLLYPYYKNLGKRLIKSPKLYFVDTGVACSLINIRSPEALIHHYLRGGLIESFIISDLFKQYYNLDRRPSLYFWRDYHGNKIDCILEEALYVTPIEIKGGKTVAFDYFKQFKYWKEIATLLPSRTFVIYAGSENRSWPEAKVLSWKSAGTLVKDLEG
jgi:uncharacterized protein